MEDKIFSVTDRNFESLAIDIFHFQYGSNQVYQSWVKAIGVDPRSVKAIQDIPFLPIGFFKSQIVTTTTFEPASIFESSGTTGMVNSRHYVKSMDLYHKSFMKGFQFFYGDVEQYAILGLLPSYLERKNSSLIVMVDALVRKSNKKSSGFYLHEYEELEVVLLDLVSKQQPVILIGVTFALLDFAQSRELDLQKVIVMETGGMKGRREELTREEVHSVLKKNLGVETIHSEYGMTELLSQSYASAGGMFQTPPWMKVMIRDEEDPLSLKAFSSNNPVKGVLNIIDLANLYSCSFIATDDLGTLYPHNFTVDGRLDKSDLRGCSLLSI